MSTLSRDAIQPSQSLQIQNWGQFSKERICSPWSKFFPPEQAPRNGHTAKGNKQEVTKADSPSLEAIQPSLSPSLRSSIHLPNVTDVDKIVALLITNPEPLVNHTSTPRTDGRHRRVSTRCSDNADPKFRNANNVCPTLGRRFASVKFSYYDYNDATFSQFLIFKLLAESVHVIRLSCSKI